MKAIALVFMVVFATFALGEYKGSGRIKSSDVIRLEIGSDSDIDKQDIRELRKRVRQLEKAVAQLQQQIWQITYPYPSGYPSTVPVGVPPTQHTCFINTTFKGTVTANGTTITEAKAKTLQACDAADGGLSCKPENLQCDK